MLIFDSSVWIAFLNKKDSQHKKAEKIFENAKDMVGIPEYIILEVCSVLSMRVNKEVANNFIDMVFYNKDTKIIFSDSVFCMHVIDTFKDYNKNNLSFVDASLLYLSKSYHIITLDKDLEKAIKNKS